MEYSKPLSVVETLNMKIENLSSGIQYISQPSLANMKNNGIINFLHEH